MSIFADMLPIHFFNTFSMNNSKLPLLRRKSVVFAKIRNKAFTFMKGGIFFILTSDLINSPKNRLKSAMTQLIFSAAFVKKISQIKKNMEIEMEEFLK